MFYQWRTQSLTAIRDIVGQAHIYAEEFDQKVNEAYASKAQAGKGILLALREDVASGYLVSYRKLVEAEVFSDFLDMAEHLLQNGYIHPAASLCGAILEDGLRRIATNHAVALKSGDDLSALNQKCAQGGVYNRLVYKQIAVWTTIRNHADHGEFNEYSEQDVKDMHKGVKDFLSAHLA